MLKEAVSSVLNQTYEDFNLLIGNDCPEVPVSFKTLGIEPDFRITIINRKSNIGEFPNLNDLLDRTESEWFTWLGDDDVLHPDFLNIMLENLESQSGSPVAAFSNYEAGGVFDKSFLKKQLRQNALILDQDEFIKLYVHKQIKLIGCYGVMKVSELKKVSGIPLLGNSLGPYSDTLLPILLTQFGKLSWVDMPLVFLRTHSGSKSASSADFEAYSTAENEFLDDLERTCGTRKYFLPMVKWFADDQLHVISRGNKELKYRVLIKFITYQLRVNLTRLNIIHWPEFALYIFPMVVRFIISGWRSKTKRIIYAVFKK